MKLNVTNILLGVLIVILLWQNFFGGSEPVEPQPITITMPEVKGTTGAQIVEKVIQVPVYLPNNQKISVDNKYKKLYEQTKDSLERQNLYLEAIKINDYKEVLVDNDSIEITGYAKTRGSLLEYKVDYKIKPVSLTYIPEVKSQLPKLSLGLGVEAGVPLVPTSNFVLKGGLNIINSKGNGFNIGYDTEQRVWLGVSKTFKLIK